MNFIRFAFLCFFAPLSMLCAQTNTFYVATNGSDSNPGTEDAPFLTLQQARDAVKGLSSSAFEDQDVYVILRGGTYRMQQPLMLDASDSGRRGNDVIYTAFDGETAIISGAIQVPASGWTLFSAPLGIYVNHIGQYKSRQLYINGVRAQRAQTTPYPQGFLPSFANGGPNSGIEYIIAAANPPAWQDPTTWTNQSDIEAVILTQWKMMRVPLSVVTPSTIISGLISMQEPAWTNANVYFDAATNAPGIWSFWQVTWFENALQFLTEPGQWYLDSTAGDLYYIPLPGQNLTTADVELPILETLVVGQGTLGSPIHNIRFEGLTFAYATWLGPSSNQGYVSDQSGMLLLGSDHQPNIIGHDQNIVPTPGNLQFSYANNIEFYGNIFQHLGAVALQFGTGSQKNTIDSNLFTDISSAAIELGGVGAVDHHPALSGQLAKNNLITNNLISNTGAEYMDAAGIFVGFTRKTTLSHNTIWNVPWSGIAMGWGWGLLDKGSFPGVPGAYSGQWGTYDTLSSNYGCVIARNKIANFLGVLWDGGAIYVTGRQGPTKAEGLLIKENVAYGKRPMGGGNTIYTDGGSRCIRVKGNVSYNNPIGVTFLGPPPPAGDPLPYPAGPSATNNTPYGSDTGGCVTYGDIRFTDNYWLEGSLADAFPTYNFFINTLATLFDRYAHTAPYSYYGYFSLCPATIDGVLHPIELSYKDNHPGFYLPDVPSKLLSTAGVKKRPSTIPEALWSLPPP